MKKKIVLGLLFFCLVSFALGAMAEISVTYDNETLTVSATGLDSFYSIKVDGIDTGKAISLFDSQNSFFYPLTDGVHQVTVENAIKGCFGSTSIIVKNAAASILSLPGALETIEAEAFAGDTSISIVLISSNVKRISSRAFADSSIQEIVFPEGITFIADDAFENTSLCTVSAVNGTYAYNWAVEHGYILPTSMTAFSFTQISDTTCELSNYTGAESTIVVPDTDPDGKTVVRIGNYAFANEDNHNYTSITLPDTITSIGVGAFFDCQNLDGLQIPESVTDIGERAFCGCKSLTSITLPNAISVLKERLFSGCSSLKTIVLPQNLQSVGDAVFMLCYSLNNISLPATVSSIGMYAFDGCQSLSSIVIPNGVSNIPKAAFIGCKELGSIVLPDGLKSIDNYVFQSCSALTQLNLPDSVETIGDLIIYNCERLTSIHLPSSLSSISDNAIENTALQTVTAQEGTYAYNWAVEHGYITMPGALKVIWENARLTKIDLSYRALGTVMPIRVETEVNWTTECSADWILLSQTVGSGTTDLSVTIRFNPNTAPREARIVFKTETDEQTISVYQGGNNIFCDVSSIEFDVAGGSFDVEIVTDGEWYFSTEVDWLSANISEGYGNTMVTIMCEPNTTGDLRERSISFISRAARMINGKPVSYEVSNAHVYVTQSADEIPAL